ncbi:MAG: hypothetical protein WDM84_04395 [Bauldia sp.]
MVSDAQIAELQKGQYRHDVRNHADIWSLHKIERLKHYGLHFAKYVGRLARGGADTKPISRTLTDGFLVCLSAANTMHQDLSKEALPFESTTAEEPQILQFADAAGRFADACEKIDHLEEFLPQARQANVDIASWIISRAAYHQLDLGRSIKDRRRELSHRHFYISD